MHSRFSSILLSIVALSVLNACGFEPMAASHQATSSGASATLASVAVDPVPGRVGQVFRNTLEDNLNPAVTHAPKQYRLSVSITITTNQGIIDTTGAILRYTLRMDSHYTLSRNSDGKIIHTGDVRRTASYNNVPNAYFSTYVSQEDTEKRLAQSLAEEYRMRLASILSAPEKEAAAQP